MVAVAAIAVGYGGAARPASDGGGPREATAVFLDRLAGGDVRGLCRSLSARAAAELAHDFGGASCSRSAAAAASYVAAHDDVRRAVRGVRVLRTLDVPLSPAPLRAGSPTASLRLVVDDPVLRSREAFDVGVRLASGRWHIDTGMQALFTLVGAPKGNAAKTPR